MSVIKYVAPFEIEWNLNVIYLNGFGCIANRTEVKYEINAQRWQICLNEID